MFTVYSKFYDETNIYTYIKSKDALILFIQPEKINVENNFDLCTHTNRIYTMINTPKTKNENE